MMNDVIEELTPEMTGRWLVTTQSGTQHIWDLDAMTYQRIHAGTNAFEYDGEILNITRVEWWPKIGQRSYLFFDDLRDPIFLEQWRISSTIQKIELLPN